MNTPAPAPGRRSGSRPWLAVAGLTLLACANLPGVDGHDRAATGASTVLQPGDDLQSALDAARPGDVISLPAGAVFTGPFTLPNKSGVDWITIRSSSPDSRLPPPGTQAAPIHSGAMPKLESESAPVITAAPGAHHYRFIGIEIRPRPGAFLYNVVTLGTDETSLSDVPHHIVFERCYIHGDRVVGSRRGIALNAAASAVIDSYLSDFKEVGADSQAIGGWNGPGPFQIENNYLEAAGENLLFGGSDPSIPDLVPSDIEIKRNHFAKPLVWRMAQAGHDAKAWTVKNLLELKNARRVLVDGNLFEHNWVQAQNGFAILFTVRNQNGRAPWSVVEDVTFSNNVLRGTAQGVNILGHDNNAPAESTRRITIRNNLLLDVGTAPWGGGGVLFQILDGAADVVIEHNTAFHTGNLVSTEGRPSPGFVFRDNIAFHNRYGIVGTGTGPGLPTLGAFFPDAVVKRNVIVGGIAAQYPPDNFFPTSVDAVGFVDPSVGNYLLRPGSPYKGAATDGKDVGADLSTAAKAASLPRPLPRDGTARPSVGE